MDMNQPVVEQIAELKKRRNAVLLAHNYQPAEVQDIADYVGDSLELSRRAAATSAEMIVFCGVHFMAETAAILCPTRTVLLPDPEAGCPMANMITAEDVRELKRTHPGAPVVCYVNSTAAVKAESDVCCTSANAVAVVASLPETAEVIFVPDKYLGQYVAEHVRRSLVLWPGYCPTHVLIADRHIAELKQAHPDAVVLVHPECTEPVRDLADQVLSTGGMVRYAREAPAAEFIVATEIGILHRLRQENPQKRFYAATDASICPNMKRIRTEKILWALQNMQHEVRVAEPIRTKAKQAIDRMLSLAS